MLTTTKKATLFDMCLSWRCMSGKIKQAWSMQFPKGILKLGTNINSDCGGVPPCPPDPALPHRLSHTSLWPTAFTRSPHSTIRIPTASGETSAASSAQDVPRVEVVAVKVALPPAATLDTVLRHCTQWAGEGSGGS